MRSVTKQTGLTLKFLFALFNQSLDMLWPQFAAAEKKIFACLFSLLGWFVRKKTVNHVFHSSLFFLPSAR